MRNNFVFRRVSNVSRDEVYIGLFVCSSLYYLQIIRRRRREFTEPEVNNYFSIIT